MALQGREAQARSDLERLFESGITFSQLQLGLLASAAEKLGALWEDDSVSFVDVTIAMGMLQRLMHFVSLELEDAPAADATARRILLFPDLGAQHIFGASMAAEFFKHAGWKTDFIAKPDRRKLCDMVATTQFDVIGLSLSRQDSVPEAASVIRDVKAASCNPDVLTIAGGPVLVVNPSLIDVLGIDAAILELDSAPERVESLIKDKTDRD